MGYDTQLKPRNRNYGVFNSRFYALLGTNLNPAAVPAGAGWIDLGNCTASQQKSGVKSVPITRARNGFLSRSSNNISTLEPELEITLNEVRAIKLVPLLIFGAQGPDTVQAAATSNTANLNGVYGDLVYELGKHVVSNVVVNIGTAQGPLAAENVDYEIHYPSGRLTVIAGGAIPDSTSSTPSNLVVTFANAATTRTNFTEYTQPNRTALLRWLEEDVYSQDGVATVKTAYCQLMAGDPGSNDPTKDRADKINASILGQVVRSDRKDL